MKSLKRYFLLQFCFFLVIACESPCRLKKINTLFAIQGQGPNGVAYMHNVLLKGFTKQCVDSITMVSLAQKYIDTVKIGQPVDLVCFYTSDKDFNLDEVSQEMEKIDKSCLVKIGFNEKTKQPTDFSFFDENGERIFSGNKWYYVR